MGQRQLISPKTDLFPSIFEFWPKTEVLIIKIKKWGWYWVSRRQLISPKTDCSLFKNVLNMFFKCLGYLFDICYDIFNWIVNFKIFLKNQEMGLVMSESTAANSAQNWINQNVFLVKIGFWFKIHLKRSRKWGLVLSESTAANFAQHWSFLLIMIFCEQNLIFGNYIR